MKSAPTMTLRTAIYGDEYRYVRERAGYTRQQIIERAEEMQGLMRTQQSLAWLEGGEDPMPERWVEILRLTIGTEVYEALRLEWSDSVGDVADEGVNSVHAVDRHDAEGSESSAMSRSEPVAPRTGKSRKHQPSHQGSDSYLGRDPHLGSDGLPEQQPSLQEHGHE